MYMLYIAWITIHRHLLVLHTRCARILHTQTEKIAISNFNIITHPYVLDEKYPKLIYIALLVE
jgi:hypothetical protein